MDNIQCMYILYVLQVMESEPEQSNSGTTQSMDEPIPSSDVAPPTVTSDYYSDSVQEDNSQMVVDNPQIAQDSLPIVPPISTIPIPAPLFPTTSTQSKITDQERKIEPEVRKLFVFCQKNKMTAISLFF